MSFHSDEVKKCTRTRTKAELVSEVHCLKKKKDLVLKI